MPAESFDFACDRAAYRLDDAADAVERRTGIAYYCRPHTPRRAHELAVFALERFARQHPEVPIHTYGSVLPDLPFEATQHGVLPPSGLSALYNRCVAGLSLSATNVSLVPLEMLGSGCVPVVNDARHNRIVLDNDQVRYSAPTPWDLARSLSDLVEQDRDTRAATAAAAAASVTGQSWTVVEDQVVSIFERLAAEAVDQDPSGLDAIRRAGRQGADRERRAESSRRHGREWACTSSTR